MDEWRRRTGIEPARPRYSISPVLKTGGTTRNPDASAVQPIAPCDLGFWRRDRISSDEAIAHGGGCACKIPPGELEEAVRGLAGQSGDNVLVGLDDGDDAAAVLVGDVAVLSTADFFTPVVDDAYDWGRIAAANALSDIYAMGGRPVVAINLVGWPRGVLPMELLTEVLRGGLAVASEAGCPVIGGHSIDDPEPKYGMAVTGMADPQGCCATMPPWQGCR